ncbi:hypothetical protein RVIR1_06260 [Candidatus Rickettsiella viridis]|uniref:Uncharacterized protein n=1 Tax=Candidatus Rickettsiella viridis TaxID=676208 RepID=A0A2Z5V730_9COXI|nr:hypothetical protein [Candidatus Rickettsiella viridis]BBB15127.1 hypothetical protein RVIR1_06260 [Candidatus Rickettsiella viridis]
MMDTALNTNSGDKQSDVQSMQKESVSEDSSPWSINTALLSYAAKQEIGFKAGIRQRFF